MAGDHGVRDIARADAGHVAGDTLCSWLVPLCGEQSLMTSQAGGTNFPCARLVAEEWGS